MQAGSPGRAISMSQALSTPLLVRPSRTGPKGLYLDLRGQRPGAPSPPVKSLSLMTDCLRDRVDSVEWVQDICDFVCFA